MKVLVVWYDYFHYLSSIVAAFNAIEDVCADKFVLEYFKKQASTHERLLDSMGIKYFENTYHNDTKQALLTRCREYNPDLVLFLNGEYRHIVDDEVFTFLKKTKIATALWFVDSIKNIDGIDAGYLSRFDHIYSFEYSDVQYIQDQYGIEYAKYLPLGAASDIYHDNYNLDKKYDICFVGANDPKRLSILEFVAQNAVKNNWKMIVYGHMWKQRPVWTSKRHELKFKKTYPNLYGFVVNKYLTPQEVAKLYAQSKICLNIIRSAHSGANPRTFEIMATNSLQLVDYNKNIEMILQNGKHLVMYKDESELEQLLQHYLSNEDDRESIAANGWCITTLKYTLQPLANLILRDVRGIL